MYAKPFFTYFCSNRYLSRFNTKRKPILGIVLVNISNPSNFAYRVQTDAEFVRKQSIQQLIAFDKNKR